MKRLSAFLRMLIEDPANPWPVANAGPGPTKSSGSNSGYSSDSDWGINPATLLPMEDGFYDIGGNAMGFGANGSAGGFSSDTGMSDDDYATTDCSYISDDCSAPTFSSSSMWDD